MWMVFVTLSADIFRQMKRDCSEPSGSAYFMNFYKGTVIFMLGQVDFEKIDRRYEDFWNLENHDLPILQITARDPKYSAKEIKEPSTMEDYWFDMDYLFAARRESMNRTYYAGDSYPRTFPNLGPDVFGGLFGCPMSFDRRTAWAGHLDTPIRELSLLNPDQNGRWWKQTMEMTRLMVEDAKGDYIVGMTDIHPGLDALVAIRGPEQLCLDLLEEPEEVLRLLEEIFPTLEAYFSQQFKIISDKQKGCTNWLGLYHPKRWYVSSCDFITLISDAMLRKFCLPGLRREINFYENSIFHLDGMDAFRHLDALLEIENLHGIQLVYGAGQPGVLHWIPLLQKIQGAGKSIHVSVNAAEIPSLIPHLRPEGLCIAAGCETPEQAEELISFVASHYQKSPR